MVSQSNKLLIGDLAANTCAYLADLASQFGYQPVSSQSIGGILRKLERDQFNGILINLDLLAREECDLFKWLHDHGRNEAVIVMSETADYDLLIEVVKRGAADLVALPVQPILLKRSLDVSCAVRRKQPHPGRLSSQINF